MYVETFYEKKTFLTLRETTFFGQKNEMGPILP